MSEFLPIPSTPSFKDLTGQVFGKWTVLGYVGRKHSSSAWKCRCECGEVKIVLGNTLRGGFSKGCRCYLKKHGCSVEVTPEYAAWSSMKSRCSDPSVKHFKNYGGRGIKVCERWQSFEHFLADMGPRPSSAHSIDRIDNDGNYEPGNCRWATIKEQNRNKRTTKLFTLDGLSLCLSEWSERFGIKLPTLVTRIKRGLSLRDALTLQKRGRPSRWAS